MPPVHLRFTRDAYTIAVIEGMLLGRALPSICASHTTLIPLHNWKNAAQARPPADSRFTYDAYIVALIEGMLGRQNFPCNDSSYNNDSNITGI